MRSPPSLRRLALFDLDGTLFHRDTEQDWAYLLGAVGLIDPRPFDAFQEAYRQGTLHLPDYYAWYLDVFRRTSLPELERLRDRLIEECLLPAIAAEARAWIANERKRSDAVLLVTASNAFLTEPLGARLGFDATLATRLERSGERFTGRIDGLACFREHKLTHVRNWLASRGQSFEALERVCFYTDSHNDLPLLERVHEPRVVEPDARLAAEAERRGWPVLRLPPPGPEPVALRQPPRE
jgi:HAD superfamily hydrolase (TIGR01490 family)